MGQKLSDGKAFDLTAPSGQIINDYDLYRIGGINGCAIGKKDATQTDRTLSFEAETNTIYSIKVPTALVVRVGMSLFWANQTVFQRGDTDLRTEPPASGDAPCFFVTGTKNTAGYIQGRVLNGGAVPSFVVS